jgi:hypothetical protein
MIAVPAEQHDSGPFDAVEGDSTLPFNPLGDNGGFSDTGSTSNTNRREDNDANNNDANRTSRNGSDDERLAEVEDNDNNSMTEDEYDNYNNFNNNFLPSLLPCLLLHQNHGGESSDYNAFLSSSVNMRKYLNMEKLLPDITDEAGNKSLVSRTMEANDMTTPLDGRYNVVLVSFEKLGEDEKSAAVLYPTYSGAPLSEENGSKYKAIPPSPETLLKGLEWLCSPQSPTNLVAATYKERMESLLGETWSDVSEDHGNKFILELSQMYVERLYQAAPTNQTSESLRKFIDDRDWTGDHVWGGPKKEFLDETDLIEDDHERWTKLRNYVCCNMAWTTELIILPADSLHRSATADCILRGHPPPEADESLRNKVQEYWGNINHDEGLLVDRKQKASGQKKKKKESKIILTCIVPETIDSSFMLKMQGISAMAQEKGQHASEHTMIHMLNAVGEHVSEKLDHRYLIWNGDNTHGLSRVLRGLSDCDRREEFMTILEDDGLCHDRSEAVIICDEIEEQANQDDAKRRRIKSTWNDKKETSGLSVSSLAEIYVRFWMKKFIKTVFESVNYFVQNHPTIVEIDDEVGLGDIAKMTKSEFSNIFRRQINGKEDWTINPYSMKGIWNGTVTKPFLMYDTRGYLNVGLGLSDPFDSSVVKIPTERGDKIFRHQLVDFVWLLFLSNLSPVCHGSLGKYFSDAPCSNRLKQRGSSKGGRARARVNVRCLTLTISHAAQAGRALYNDSYFGSSKQSQTKPDKMGKICQDVLFLISAVTHTCPTFCDFGQNPDPPPWATPVPFEKDPLNPSKKDPLTLLLSILRKGNWKIGNRIRENYVCLVTFAFCLYMHDHSNDAMKKSTRSTDTKKCQTLVCASLAGDCGKTEVTSTKYIGMWSSNGNLNLDMRPDSGKIPHFGMFPEPNIFEFGEFPDPNTDHPRLETIIQVLRMTHVCGGYGTQRIGEFIQDCLHEEKIWFAIQDKADEAIKAKEKRTTFPDKANLIGNTQQKDGVAGMVGGDAVEGRQGEQMEQTDGMSASGGEEEDQTQGAVGRDEDKIEKSAEGRDKKSRKRANSSRSPAKKSNKRPKHVAAILKLEEDVMNHEVVMDLVENIPECAQLTGVDLQEYIHTNMDDEKEWKWITAEIVQTFVENKRADIKQKKEADAKTDELEDMTGVLTDDISETGASGTTRNPYIDDKAEVIGGEGSDEDDEDGPNVYNDNDSFIDNETNYDGSGYDPDKINAPVVARRGKILPKSPPHGKTLPLPQGKEFRPNHANNGPPGKPDTLRERGRGKQPPPNNPTPKADDSSSSSGETEEEENTSHHGGTTKEDNSKNERRSSLPNGEEPGKSVSSSGDGDEEVGTKDTSSNVEDVGKKDTSNINWAATNALKQGTTNTASQGSDSDDYVLDPHALYEVDLDDGEQQNFGFGF